MPLCPIHVPVCPSALYMYLCAPVPYTYTCVPQCAIHLSVCPSALTCMRAPVLYRCIIVPQCSEHVPVCPGALYMYLCAPVLYTSICVPSALYLHLCAPVLYACTVSVWLSALYIHQCAPVLWKCTCVPRCSIHVPVCPSSLNMYLCAHVL